MFTTVLSTVVLLGVLIFVHELGHFLVAKRSGVTVLRFSLGFGPKIVGITRGDTEYRLSLIPLGGYVKMLGEDAEEELPQADLAGSFSEQRVGKRLAIVFAGPLSNFITGFLVFTLLFALVGIPEPTSEPEIGSVISGSPAEKAGLKSGDRVLSIDGQPIHTWMDIPENIKKIGPNPLKLGLRRGDSEFTVTVTPSVDEIKIPLTGETIKQPMIGIRPVDSVNYKPINPLLAGYYALEHVYDLSKLFFTVVVKLVQGVLPLKTLGGPIFIAQEAGKEAQKGLPDYFNFMGLLSVNLAVLNLLPIPILDGGHIFFFLFEAIFGKPLSVKKREIAQLVGLVAILSLMVVVIYNDLMRLDWSPVASWLHNLRSRL